VLLTLFLVPNNFDNTPDFGYAVNFTIFLVMGLIMLFDFSFPFVIDYFEKLDAKNAENERLLLQNQLDYQQMLMLTEEKQEFRKIKHDYANILATARGFIEIGKPEKALNILQNTDEDLSTLANFSLCSNETINTIIYIKQQQAKKANANIDVTINEMNTVKVNDYDLCRVLSNIIDNALNATCILNNDKNCTISIDIDENSIVIKSKNRYNANTTKKGKSSKDHGNGIGIINEIVSKYDGKYISKQENGVWYTPTTVTNKALANSTPPPEFWLNFERCF
jgi:signal transduction histidine kinase